MNTYPTFNPPCLEKDFSSRERSHSKSSQPKAYPTQSNLIQQSRKRILHSSIFVEASLSPAKYALFQYLGTCFLQLTGCPHASKSYTLAAKTGAFGGIIIAVFYFLLVVTRDASLPPNPDAEQHANKSAWILLHEMLYSALASAVGSVAYSWSGMYHIELGINVFAGGVGPLLCLVLFSLLVGMVWCAMWSQKKFMDWYTGYL